MTYSLVQLLDEFNGMAKKDNVQMSYGLATSLIYLAHSYHLALFQKPLIPLVEIRDNKILLFPEQKKEDPVINILDDYRKETCSHFSPMFSPIEDKVGDIIIYVWDCFCNYTFVDLDLLVSEPLLTYLNKNIGKEINHLPYEVIRDYFTPILADGWRIYFSRYIKTNLSVNP